MDIQDRIRRLQANVVNKRAGEQRLSEEKSTQAAGMSEEQFTEAFKNQVQARDAKLMAEQAAAPAPQRKTSNAADYTRLHQVQQGRIKVGGDGLTRGSYRASLDPSVVVKRALSPVGTPGYDSNPSADAVRDPGAPSRAQAKQATVVKPGVNSAGVRPPSQQAAPETPEQRSARLSAEAAAMSPEQFTEAFKRQYRARDEKIMAKVAESNAMIERIRAAQQGGSGSAPNLSALASQMMYLRDGSKRPLPSREMLDKWADIDAQAGRKRQDGGHIAVPPVRPYTDADAMDARRESLQEHNQANRSRNASYGSVGPRALPGILPPDQAAAQSTRDTHAERIEQLTESGMTPDEAARIAGFERSVHGGVSPQLSDANNTPEAKAERAMRTALLRRTEARQDNYTRGQLDGHLTGREAVEARAQQEGLRGAPAAKPQGWQPISLQDFTDRAAGYGLTPEAAAKAYEERPDVMRDTGNSRVLQAQASRAQAEWLKTMPGIHRKHAQEDAAKYGYGTPEDQITPEQYNARIERRNKERAALDPAYARERQIAKLAKASGKTPEEVEADMFPKGVPQPSEEFKERQAARKAQHARANEKIWERKGYRGHLHEKTLSGDPATVREGLNRLHTITGDPAYLERIKALDAADAETAAHTRGMEKLTAEQQQALMMQNDAQAADENLELLRQKGAKGARDDQAVESDKGRVWESGEKALDRGQALTLQERTDLHELEKMRLAGKLEGENARRHAQLKMKVDAHAAGLAEAAAAAQQPRDIEKIEATGRAEEGVEGVRVGGKGTPSDYGRQRADAGLAAPGASVRGLEQSLANDLRVKFPHLGADEALVQAQNELKGSALRLADSIPGSTMPGGVRDHLKEEIRLGADGQGKKPMSQVQFREYAIRLGMSPAAADRVYTDITSPPVPSTGDGSMPPLPPGGVAPRGRVREWVQRERSTSNK